ncbi:MAG: carboxypeptidase regulatory-like domain-containing protein [Acidovorax sp.]|nr:carboxypeptidase regulatory-like domain-containing protein [Acidovorax sp.]
MRVPAIGRAVGAWLRQLCGVFIVLFSIPVLADEAAGLSWLQGQEQASGSLVAESSSIALPVQSRSEAATTFRMFAKPVPPALLNAIDVVNDDTVEVLARKSLAKQLQLASTAYLDALAQRQNADGGFGATGGYASNAQDTAWALAALTASRASYPAAVDQAIAWLLATQQPDGQWSVAPDGDALAPTALAVQSLHPYRQATAAASALSKARTWLLAERGAASSWGSPVRNAQALLAVLPGIATAASVQPAVDVLKAVQRADGSWEGDPYVTALALRALWVAAQPVTDPDLASLQGRILSESTGQPMVGVPVRLAVSGKTAVTDAQGRFRFEQLTTGSDKLVVEVQGYLSLSADVQWLKGQNVDLGTIALKARSSANASTVTITGVAKFTNDGATYQNAANAIITVGALTAKTNASGEYTLAGVSPGIISLQAAYPPYQQVDASFSAQAGQQVRLDPLFIRGTDQSTLKVVVTDQASGSLIAGASVSLNGIVRSTNAKGEAYFSTGVTPGDNNVTVSASGHVTRVVAFTVQGYHSINLPIALAAAATPPGETVLQGSVTDAATLLPVAGATVTIEGAGRSVSTDAAGRYMVNGAPDFAGTRKVLIEKAGYQRHEQTIAIVQGRAHQFDVPLQLLADTSQPIRILVAVTDKATLQPIAGAAVNLSGSNPHALKTNAQGVAEASGLNMGTTQIQVTAAGYDNAAFSVDLAAGRSYQLPVELTPQIVGSDRLHGTVLDAQSRRPLAGARVILAGSKVLETTSDANGRYEFAPITLGRWNLSAITAGYKGSSRGFDITSSTQIDIPLTPDYGIQDAGSSLRAVAVGHPNYTSAAVGYLFVFGPQGTRGSVVSNDGAMNHSFAIGATGVAEVMVPSHQFLSPANTVLDKALFIHATNPVSASFLNRETYTTDMTYLLDVEALGTEYRILGWQHAYGYIQMSVTAVEDATSVSITPAKDLTTGQKAGVPFSVALNKGQSVFYTAESGNDLTGTHIVASKPLAVFSGGQCVNLPVGHYACDHIFTQLPPVAQWASDYVIPETANTGSAGNLVRILAHTDGTAVEINGTVGPTLNAGQFHEIATAKDLHITTTHPVLVGQFLKGFTATNHGDPAFSYINGIDQTLKDYLFTAPVNLAAYAENFLNLAVPTSALASLELNGKPVNTSAFRPVGSTGYSAGSVAIAPGPGRIKAGSPFLATISGFSTYDSYHTIIGASYSAGASSLDPIVAKISVATDQPTYPVDAPVQLTADIANQGNTEFSLRIELRINDTNGNEVVRFAARPLGRVAAGATVSHVQPWNTARYPAGTYTLIGTLLNTKGEAVGAASTLFAITTGGAAGGPKAALTLAVNKAEYAQNDRVRIDNLVRNLTANASIDDARVRITVRNPRKAVVFTYVHAMGQLGANGVRPLDVQQLLKDAIPGTYTVEAVLIGNGHNFKKSAKADAVQAKGYDIDVELATAHTSYVVRKGGPGGAPVPGGNVAAVPVNQPWFLWLVGLALAGMAGQRLRKGPGTARGQGGAR